MREITAITVARQNDWVSITVTANAFLQHMVRNIAGLLTAIGNGGEKPDWAATVLAGRDRSAGGIAAPAHGLTLVSVTYPARFALADNSEFLPPRGAG